MSCMYVQAYAELSIKGGHLATKLPVSPFSNLKKQVISAVVCIYENSVAYSSSGLGNTL